MLPWWQLFSEIRQRAAIPLHYNIHFGVDLFGAWWLIFMIPAIGWLIFIINLISATLVLKRDRILSYFFIMVSLFSQMILFVAMIFVVLLNLSYG